MIGVCGPGSIISLFLFLPSSLFYISPTWSKCGLAVQIAEHTFWIICSFAFLDSVKWRYWHYSHTWQIAKWQILVFRLIFCPDGTDNIVCGFSYIFLFSGRVSQTPTLLLAWSLKCNTIDSFQIVSWTLRGFITLLCIWDRGVQCSVKSLKT